MPLGGPDKTVTIRLEAEDALTPSIARARSEMAGLAKATREAGRSTSAFNNAGAGVSRVGVAATASAAAMGRLGSSAPRSLSGIEKRIAPVNTLLNEMAESAKKASAEYDAMSAVGSRMMKVGAGMAVGIGFAAKAYAQFDAEMSKVRANSGATGAALNEMRNAAITMGMTTQFSATQAATAMNELSKAGVNNQQIIGGGLKGALDLAAAGQMSVSEAAETAATAMTQFNLSGAAVPHIADLLAAGANNAQGSVHDMGFAFRQAGLVAHSTGLSVEDTAGALTMFARAGLIGSDAGTSLKTMLQRLTPQSDAARAKIEELGLNAYDANGNFIGLTQYAGLLNEKLHNMSPEARNAAMGIIFGQDAIRGANVLYEAGAGATQHWIDKTNEAGFAAKNAATLQDNLVGDLHKLKGAFVSVVAEGGGGFNNFLRDSAQIATGLMRAIGGLPAPVLQGVATLTAYATAVTLLRGATMKAAGPFAGLRASIQTFNAAVAAQRAPTEAAVASYRALGFSASQAASAAAANAPKVGYLTAAFRAAGGAGGMFRAGMSGLVGALGGPWGIAIMGATALIGMFAKRSADAAQKQQELEAAVQQVAGTVAASGGAWTKDASNQIVQIATQRNLIEGYGKLGYSVGTVTTALTQEGATRDRMLGQMNARIDVLRNENMMMDKSAVSSRNKNNAEIDSLTNLRDGLVEVAGVGSEAAAKGRLAAEAERSISEQAGGAADGTKQLSEGLDGVAGSADKAYDSMNKYADAITKGRQAQSDYHASLNELKKNQSSLSGAVTKGGKDFDLTTEKGQKAQKALLDFGNGARDAAYQQLSLGRGSKVASDQMKTAREQFISFATGMKLSQDAAEQLAAQLGLDVGAIQDYAKAAGMVPPVVSTDVTTMGADQAAVVMDHARKKAEQLDKLDPKVETKEHGASQAESSLDRATKSAQKTGRQRPVVSVKMANVPSVMKSLQDIIARSGIVGRLRPIVTIAVSGAQEAIASIQSVIRKAGEWANHTFTGFLNTVTGHAVGGIYDTIAYANGGITRFARGAENHVAQIAAAGSYRLWAESETGGEAYIPLARSKRNRSTAILEEVARRFGFSLIKQANGGLLSFVSGGMLSGRGTGPDPALRIVSATVKGKAPEVPIIGNVIKVNVAKGVKAPFLYTEGGKWDRSTTRLPYDVSNMTKLFDDRYVTKAELTEAAKRNYEAQTALAEAQNTAINKNTKSLRAAQQRVSSADAAVSSAEANVQRLNKRKKKPTAAERKAANDRLAAARLRQKQAREDLKNAQRAADYSGASSPGQGVELGALAEAPAGYRKFIREAAEKYGLSPNLIAALIKNESGFNRKARSKAGAMGLMQLMPKTAKNLGVKDPYNAQQNIMGGSKYLAQLIKEFNGDVGKALAAYNAGSGNVKRGHIPKSTRAYVNRIMNDSGVKSGSGKRGASVGQSVANGGISLAQQMINYAKMMIGHQYKHGGGHSATTYKANLNKLLVDCSGLINAALGHVMKKNVNRVAKDWTRGKGIKQMSVQEGLHTVGAFLGTDKHVVISMGDGVHVIESPRPGKKVKIRTAKASEFKRAGYYTALGAPGSPSAGGSGTYDPKRLREAQKEAAAAQKEYLAKLKAYKTPAYVHLASASKVANINLAAFNKNIQKIMDRGYPSLALRLMQMGDEQGAALAASMANAPDKVLRQQRDAFEKNAKLVEDAKKREEALNKIAGPPAWKTASKETAEKNKNSQTFFTNIAKIAKVQPELAWDLLARGEEEAGDIAATAAALPAKTSAKTLRGIRQSLVYEANDVKARQKLMSSAASNGQWMTFFNRLDELRKRGYSSLADTLMDMGVEEGGPIAASALSMSPKAIRGLRNELVDAPRRINAKQTMAKLVSGTATSKAFLDNIKKIRQRGYSDLALTLLENGEEASGDMAAEAAKAADSDLAKYDKNYKASDAMAKQAQALLDELKGVSQAVDISLGMATGLEPTVRFLQSQMPVDARSGPPPQYYIQQPQQQRTAPLVQVENMYASDPGDAASKMETRLGDAVAVTGIGRL